MRTLPITGARTARHACWPLLCILSLATAVVAQDPAPYDVEQRWRRANAALQAGDAQGAADELRDVLALPFVPLLGDTYGSICYDMACALARLGEEQGALAQLRRAVDAGYRNVDWMQRDPDLESLHDQEEFASLVKRVEDDQRTGAIRYSKVLDAGYDEQLPAPLRIAGLSKLWAEAKFNFAYFDQMEKDWDQLYLEAVPKVLDAASTADYYECLAELVQHLSDGHSNVYPPRRLATHYYATPGFRTEPLGDDVAVTRILDTELEDDRFRVGAKVVAIDGVPIDEYAHRSVSPFFLSASTPQDLAMRRYGRGLLAGAVRDDVTVRFADAAGEFERSFDRRMGWPRDEALEFRDLDAGIGLLVLRSFGDSSLKQQVAKLAPQILATRGLVIDLRQNGGGNTPTWLMAVLAKEPFRHNLWQSRTTCGAERAWGRDKGWKGGGGRTVDPDERFRYAGPVALLIGPKTYSAAEDFAVMFDAADRGPLIGEATGGSTGQPLMIELPGGGRARICTKRDRYPDGRAFVGVGVLPDLEVPRTLADLRAGRDAALERALAHLGEALGPRD
ncbi:MAG: S41 family peptidase [Planctomycetota bacterium]